jgi:hypothetical protein
VKRRAADTGNAEGPESFSEEFFEGGSWSAWNTGRETASWRAIRRGGVEVPERRVWRGIIRLRQTVLKTENPKVRGKPRTQGEGASHKLPRYLIQETLKHATIARAEELGLVTRLNSPSRS